MQSYQALKMHVMNEGLNGEVSYRRRHGYTFGKPTLFLCVKSFVVSCTLIPSEVGVRRRLPGAERASHGSAVNRPERKTTRLKRRLSHEPFPTFKLLHGWHFAETPEVDGPAILTSTSGPRGHTGRLCARLFIRSRGTRRPTRSPPARPRPPQAGPRHWEG